VGQKGEILTGFLPLKERSPTTTPTYQNASRFATMHMVQVDVEKVCKIQRGLRVKRAKQKFKCLKFLDLHKRVYAFKSMDHGPYPDVPNGATWNQQWWSQTHMQNNKRLCAAREYYRLQKRLVNLRVEVLDILVQKVAMKNVIISFKDAMSCAVGSVELYHPLWNTFLPTETVRDGLPCASRHESFRTGCEQENLLRLRAEKVNSLLETLCDAVISGPKQTLRWQDQHAFTAPLFMERFVYGYYEYTTNKHVLNLTHCLEGIKVIHEFTQLSTKFENAAITNTQPSYNYYSQTKVKRFVADCQWVRTYLHEKICRILWDVRNFKLQKIPGGFPLEFAYYQKYYEPYLTQDGFLATPPQPEPKYLKEQVVGMNKSKSLFIHPPTLWQTEMALSTYTREQKTMLHANETMDNDKWHQEILRFLTTSYIPNRFHIISICGDLSKISKQITLRFPASTVTVHFLHYLQRECEIIQQVVQKLEGCADVQFDIPKFQDGESFVMYRYNYLGDAYPRQDADVQNEWHEKSFQKLIDYLQKVDECLHQMTNHVAANGFLKKLHVIDNWNELLSEDCAAWLTSEHGDGVSRITQFDTLEKMHLRVDEGKDFRDADECLLKCFLFIFTQKEKVKQNIIIAWFLHGLKTGEKPPKK